MTYAVDTNYQTWLWEKLAEKCVKNLKKHAFDAHAVPNLEEARKLVLDMISDYDSFGFGGSDTTRALGLVETLKEKGKTVYDHWVEGLSGEESLAIRKNQMNADCFLCSANAVSATGEIVNVDGMGNRTNGMTFGPKKVVIVAGMNKMRPDLHAALNRVKEVAGPMRAKSLNMETPCAETGVCNDCNSPQRICRVTVILHRKPVLTDISVVLINEALGM